MSDTDRTMDKREYQLEQDGIQLDVEITGRCTVCETELTNADFGPGINCPECGTGYGARHEIMRVSRDD
ncbi:hypothetical protein [Haloarcula amylovorans]|uniref:hypothetical protein n=1 Tax=Haloarcula amylovorans TaxID=2562280 RepID=UPI0010762062|nr:hypothetical protein [Halomicroarcula amylolytica]